MNEIIVLSPGDTREQSNRFFEDLTLTETCGCDSQVRENLINLRVTDELFEAQL
jgi:hypothetical protein